jgi:hypothetical protein
MHQYDFCIRASQGVNWPNFKFTPESNCVEEIAIDDHTKIVKHRIVSTDSQITLDYFDKRSSDTVVDNNGKIIYDQSVSIDAIYVDNIQLDINVVNQSAVYYPNYREDFVEYCEKNNIVLSTDPQHTTTFWHDGKWVFMFVHEFWDWYYLQRTFKNEHSNYIGQSPDYIKSKLAKLKKML